MQKNLFYNNFDIIVLDFKNNDKRKFWKVIRHFVKNNNSSSSIPPLCSTLPNGELQCHFKGIYLSKALTCMKISCINKICFFVKETIPLATLLYEQLIHLT